MSSITLGQLVDACRDDSFASGIVIQARLEPIDGDGAPVKPAIYEGGRYQMDTRWFGEGEDRRPTPAVVIDNVPSQANRIEAALSNARSSLGLPEFLLDLSAVGDLPVHLPRMISSFAMPHRNADAYLRDASLEGKAFMKTDLGRSLFLATADDPDALLSWMPQSLLFGFWQSHLGKKGPQTKVARSWVSEIVGYAPATTDSAVMGLKGDPLNLSIDDALTYDGDNLLDWSVTDSKKAGGKKSGDSLAEVGHGQVPVTGGPAAISFRTIEQRSSLSFAGLRRIRTTPQGRALLAAMGLAGHVHAFGRAMNLRSRCDLRPVDTRVTLLGATADVPLDLPGSSEVAGLLGEAVLAAREAGHDLAGWGREPIVLQPNTALTQAIAKTYPDFEGL